MPNVREHKPTRPTVKTRLNFDQLVLGIERLSASERATLELLLDKKFSREILKRKKELPALLRAGKLLTSGQLKAQLGP